MQIFMIYVFITNFLNRKTYFKNLKKWAWLENSQKSQNILILHGAGTFDHWEPMEVLEDHINMSESKSNVSALQPLPQKWPKRKSKIWYFAI